MKEATIKAIFTNILFVIGVILVIFGFVNSSLTLARLVIFDKYPLNSYEETRCQLELNRVVPSTDPTPPEPDQKAAQQSQQLCLESLEHQRKVDLTRDSVTSITTLISGLVLVLAFKRFIFK